MNTLLLVKKPKAHSPVLNHFQAHSILSRINVTSHPDPPYSVLISPSHLRLGFRSEAAKIIEVRKREGKRQPGRPRRVWDHDIGMELKQDGRARTGLEDKWPVLLVTAMNRRVS